MINGAMGLDTASAFGKFMQSYDLLTVSANCPDTTEQIDEKWKRLIDY